LPSRIVEMAFGYPESALRQNDHSELLHRTAVIGCLLGAAATIYLLAGLGGRVHRFVPNATAIAATLAAAAFFLVSWWRAGAGAGRLGRFVWLLVGAWVLADIVLALTPPTTRDELTHHLLMPRLYVVAGRVFHLPFAVYSYYPMLLDMLYTPWLRWGWDLAPKIVHGLFGFLTALLLYAYLAHRLNAVYGLLGFFFYLSTPIVLRLGSVAYVDLGLVFYSTAALLCLTLYLEESAALRWLVLAGLSAGFAIATKPNGMLAILLLAFVFALALARERGRSWHWMPSRLFLFGIFAIVAFSPWAIKNAFATGNPLFPFFPGLLGGATGGGDSDLPGLSILETRRLLYGESWLEIALVPLRVFFTGRDDDPRNFDGVLTPVLIAFLPWAFEGKWRRDKRLFFVFSLFYFLYALFLGGMRVRYVLPIVPPLVILAIFGIHNIYARIVRPGFLYAAVAFFAVLHGVYLWNYFQVVAPVNYILGRESRTAYLERTLPDYPVFEFVNRSLPASARIYLLFMGRRAYYCERDYYHDLGDTPALLLHVLQKAKSSGEVALELGPKGITHLVVREDLLKPFLENNLKPEAARVWDAFTRDHLERLYQDGRYAVYRLHG